MLNAGGAGVVVVKLPRGNRAVIFDAALDVDDAGGTKVGPGEFFFARPDELHGFARGSRQARGFHGALAGVFAAITRTSVGHDHAHLFFLNAKRFREFAAHAKGSLRSGPDRELVVFPFGHRGARLKRRVRNVSDRITLFEFLVRGGQTISD